MSKEGPLQFNTPPETEAPVGEGKLSGEQITAIKLSIEGGRRIIQLESSPQIALDYIKMPQAELVVKYDIQKKIGIDSPDVAKTAVHYAIHGYSGKFGTSYQGLINDPEILKIIEKKHRQIAGSITGKLAGARSGMELYYNKRGIHAQTAAERIKIGKAGVLKRGLTPLSEEEESFMKNLDLNDERYLIGATKVNVKRIAQELKERFGKDRNRNTISSFFKRMRKRNTPTNPTP